MDIFIFINCFSVFIGSALNNLLGTFHLPFMTLPFNIVSICIFLTLIPAEDMPLASHLTPQNLTDLTLPTHLNPDNLTSTVPMSISWPGVGHGILLSMGQVYAVNYLLSSCLMSLSVALYSPLLFCMCTIGATIGCFLPLLFLPPQQYTQVYSGLWGYSPILSMAAVSCITLPVSGSSILAAIANTITTVGMQSALAHSMGKVR
jgi:urea transporter